MRIKFSGESKIATAKALGVGVDRFQRGGQVVGYKKTPRGDYLPPKDNEDKPDERRKPDDL